MAASLTAPTWARADDRYEPVPADSFPYGASLDRTSFSDQVTPCECPESDGVCRTLCQSDVWRVTGDALFLQRNAPADAVLITDAINDNEILNARDVDCGVHAGFDVSLTRRLGDRFGIEARYFGVDAWDARAVEVTTPGSLLEVKSSPPRFPVAGTHVEAHASSDLHNVEINGHYFVGRRCTLLAGFRYAELDEDFAIGSSGAEYPFLYETTTGNRLSGFQLGTALRLWDRDGPLTVETVVKSGIFANRADQRSAWDGGVVLPAVADTTVETAFIGELGAIGSYRLTDHLSVRGGYRLLWIDRVALAMAQVAASDFSELRGIDTTGDAFYHGAFVGLEYVR